MATRVCSTRCGSTIAWHHRRAEQITYVVGDIRIISTMAILIARSSKYLWCKQNTFPAIFKCWILSVVFPYYHYQKQYTSKRQSINSRRYLETLDDGDLFMELIRDIANELDINVLCHKIMVNVGLLTHADRGSLFLAKGTPNNRVLVAKLFDVNQDTRE